MKAEKNVIDQDIRNGEERLQQLKVKLNGLLKDKEECEAVKLRLRGIIAREEERSKRSENWIRRILGVPNKLLAQAVAEQFTSANEKERVQMILGLRKSLQTVEREISAINDEIRRTKRLIAELRYEVQTLLETKMRMSGGEES